MIKLTHPLVIAGLGALALFVVMQKKSIVTDVAAAAANAVADAGAGLVLGIGDVLGVPRTDPAKCAAAKASGSLWDQSMYCTGVELGSSVSKMVADRGLAWQNQYKEVPVTQGQTYGQKYEGPLVNDQGYDFGNLSG